MKYKLVSRKNPQKPAESGKLYASPVNDGRVSQREIAANNRNGLSDRRSE